MVVLAINRVVRVADLPGGPSRITLRAGARRDRLASGEEFKTSLLVVLKSLSEGVVEAQFSAWPLPAGTGPEAPVTASLQRAVLLVPSVIALKSMMVAAPRRAVGILLMLAFEGTIDPV